MTLCAPHIVVMAASFATRAEPCKACMRPGSFDEHGDEILQEDKKCKQQFVVEQKTSLMRLMARLGGALPLDSVSLSQVVKRINK